jgi:hypothetical protein
MFVQMFVQSFAGLPGYDYCSKKSPKKLEKAQKTQKKAGKPINRGFPAICGRLLYATFWVYLDYLTLAMLETAG